MDNDPRAHKPAISTDGRAEAPGEEATPQRLASPHHTGT